jgi:DAK2 domain fusion protein YloV
MNKGDTELRASKMMITRQAFRANANQGIDGYLLKQLFGAGLTWLEQHKEKVNRLNVFPVPDGDTGTNMYLTMRNAYLEISSLEEANVGKLSRAVADGALKGARGNSGVILSQIFAGTAKVLEGQDKLTAPLLAEACQSAVDAAYRSVEKPVEGTILTVSRQMCEAVMRRHQAQDNLVALLKSMVFAGRVALRHTPEQLPVLKKAGVVDSGGAGLVYIFEGMLRALCGKALVSSEIVVEEAPRVETWQDALVPEDELGYGYDVQFLMRGSSLNIDEVRRHISDIGWSTLVVGNNQLIKVHVHVHDPGIPLSYAIGLGANLDDVVVENMQRQYEEYVDTREQRTHDVRTDIRGVAVITVASGAGLRQLFSQQLNAAHVLTGGQTMNPSTGDFLNAINAIPNTDIILLPNNKNVILAAQQAAANAEGKHVRVVPSTTLPQGIAAMFEYVNLCSDDGCTLSDVVNAMTSALPNVVTCEITNATRDAEFEGVHVRAGQYIGLINDTLTVAGDDAASVMRELLHKANADRYERVTLYFGSDATEANARHLADALAQDYGKQEFEIVNGGQALYPYIISIE